MVSWHFNGSSYGVSNLTIININLEGTVPLNRTDWSAISDNFAIEDECSETKAGRITYPNPRAIICVNRTANIIQLTRKGMFEVTHEKKYHFSIGFQVEVDDGIFEKRNRNYTITIVDCFGISMESEFCPEIPIPTSFPFSFPVSMNPFYGFIANPLSNIVVVGISNSA